MVKDAGESCEGANAGISGKIVESDDTNQDQIVVPSISTEE